MSATVCLGGETLDSSSGDSGLPDWPGAPGWTTRELGGRYGGSPAGRRATNTPAPTATVATAAAMTRRRGEDMNHVPIRARAAQK
ncbi:hypothetical protein Pme01_37030 [Planosporangium mesophilum]|uniref:Uncharacterized protein n=1 Tax=Planosporangium mesophilum TaxID=689768 RepID=A0A8J3TEN9_9ACTN|nr:hypothetical protein Pme01_37030 [Planosporangium mesophilum]